MSGKAEVTIEWGGKEGTKVSGSISESANDHKGNQVEAKVKVESDGIKKATISASHEKSDSSKK